ncbi:MAG: hypothetical protein Q8N77_06095, partial [Nanoarchaeota archaeon]|nr:hypothetical protein [Nanoarchaeota archaeon]
MNLEKLTEKEKVEKLGYAPYEAFNKLNKLLINIFTDICEKEKKGEAQMDQYVCSSLEHLATLMLSIRGRYERNNIKFEEKDVFSCKNIEQIFTANKDEEEKRKLKKVIEEAYNFGITGVQLEKLISSATSKIIQGIETSLSKIPKYEPKYSSKELHKFIEQNLKEVKEYAQIGVQLGDILVAMEMGRKGHLIKAEMEKLTNTKELMKKIKDEQMDKVLRPVIDMHAEMYNLPFDGNSSSFLGEPGEKIDWIMILTKGIKETQEVITESQVAGRKKFLGATTDGEIHIHRYADDVNKTVKKNGLAPALAEYVRRDKDFEALTDKVNAPFEDLEDKLNSLGTGYELAKKVAQYLSTEMLCRGITKFKTVQQEGIYKILAKKIDTENEDSMDKYAIAMKLLIERLSGKKIHEFAFSYFEKGEVHSSNAISGWMLATKKGRDGKSKIIYENMKRRELEDLLDTAKKQFTKKEHEVLVTENTGVCFTFDFLMGTITSNFRSLIEIQNAFEEMSNADELSGLIYKTAVMAHETTHASQINSRLIWRSIAVSVAAYAAEMTLKWKKEGRLDYESPEGRNCFEKQTYRFEMIRLLDEIAAQALGVGEMAESYRLKGVYDAIIEKGAKLSKDGRFNHEY